MSLSRGRKHEGRSIARQSPAKLTLWKSPSAWPSIAIRACEMLETEGIYRSLAQPYTLKRKPLPQMSSKQLLCLCSDTFSDLGTYYFLGWPPFWRDTFVSILSFAIFQFPLVGTFTLCTDPWFLSLHTHRTTSSTKTWWLPWIMLKRDPQAERCPWRLCANGGDEHEESVTCCEKMPPDGSHEMTIPWCAVWFYPVLVSRATQCPTNDFPGGPQGYCLKKHRHIL